MSVLTVASFGNTVKQSLSVTLLKQSRTVKRIRAMTNIDEQNWAGICDTT